MPDQSFVVVVDHQFDEKTTTLVDNKKIELELLSLQKKVSEMTFKFQNKILETEQESHDRMVKYKIKQDKTVDKEIKLQQKLLTDSYELRIQHLSNAWERNERKNAIKTQENLNNTLMNHEYEIMKLKNVYNTVVQDLSLQEQIKQNNMLKICHEQKQIIADLVVIEKKRMSLSSERNNIQRRNIDDDEKDFVSFSLILAKRVSF